MLVDVDIECALRHLGGPNLTVHDDVVPATQPTLPTNCYRPEYAWQHSYERSFMRRTKDWIGAQRAELIGAAGLFSEALSNAYAHGNQRDPHRVIEVELYTGQKGYLLRVAQSGKGFDYQTIVAKYRRREHYYSIGGNGIRKLDSSPCFRTFFGDGGRAVHLWYDSSH